MDFIDGVIWNKVTTVGWNNKPLGIEFILTTEGEKSTLPYSIDGLIETNALE